MKNIDKNTVDGFGDEWSRFDQSFLDEEEQQLLFNEYFSVFPWKQISTESIGFDLEAFHRPSDEIGDMPFTRTLEDWAKFDINNRTRFDATISSGLAIMANQKHLYTPVKKQSKISINFARYNNKGTTSQIIRQ